MKKGWTIPYNDLDWMVQWAIDGAPEAIELLPRAAEKMLHLIRAEVEEKTAQPVWIATPPAVAGWYWCKPADGEVAMVKVHVSPLENEPTVNFAGTDFVCTARWWTEKYQAKWCGPMEPPAE